MYSHQTSHGERDDTLRKAYVMHRQYTEIMGYKTISLSDLAYRKLKAERRPRESFSDVVIRLLEAKQPPLMKYAGAWKPLTAAELEEIRARIDRLRHAKPAR